MTNCKARLKKKTLKCKLNIRRSRIHSSNTEEFVMKRIESMKNSEMQLSMRKKPCKNLTSKIVLSGKQCMMKLSKTITKNLIQKLVSLNKKELGSQTSFKLSKISMNKS
jgi:hypothetical protein